MTLRQTVFWCHLTAGALAGVVVLVMSVTGVLLAYERQITAWADGCRVTPPAPGAPRLGLEALAARAQEARPEARFSTITVRADAGAPAAFGLGREGTLFVDPYSGRVLGEGSRRARAFFRVVTDWHRWLGASGEGRNRARAVTGAANLAFLFLVSSGFYLWWPRRWTSGRVAAVTLFQRGLRGKARDFNRHNVVGSWSAVPLFLIVLCGVVISYPWAGDLLYRLTGSEPPPRPAARERAGGPPRRPAHVLLGLDRAWDVAQRQVAGWQSIVLRLPGSPDEPAAFTIDTSHGAVRPDRRGQLTVDLRSGSVVRWEPYAGQSRGRRLRAWVRWIHTGEAFGLAGQTVAFAASAGGAVLVWTGLSLAWRRFRAWRGQRVPQARELVA